MPVNQALCQAAGAKPEDVVEVVMERDAEERNGRGSAGTNEGVGEKQVSAEARGRARLHAQEGNREFDLGAKQEETRERRLAKVMRVLKTEAKWTG